MSGIDRLRRAPLPAVEIRPWTLATGWPGFHVYLDAPAWGFDGDGGELYIEAETIEEARAAADTLARATGWPVQITMIEGGDA